VLFFGIWFLGWFVLVCFVWGGGVFFGGVFLGVGPGERNIRNFLREEEARRKEKSKGEEIRIGEGRKKGRQLNLKRGRKKAPTNKPM